MSQTSALFEHVHHPLCFVLEFSVSGGVCESFRQIPSNIKNSLKFNITDIHFHISSFISPPWMEFNTEDQEQNHFSMCIPAIKYVCGPKACCMVIISFKAPVFCVLLCRLNSYSLKHCNLCSFKV